VHREWISSFRFLKVGSELSRELFERVEMSREFAPIHKRSSPLFA